MKIRPADLGADTFLEKWDVRLAYVAGALYKGIASEAHVARMARAGLLAFFGSGGLRRNRLEEAACWLTHNLKRDQPFGFNLLANPVKPALEEEVVDLLLHHKIHKAEASAYTQLSPALVRYRATGICLDASGQPTCEHLLIAKLSRPEVAQQFLSPPPEKILRSLVENGKITQQQAHWAAHIPMADALTVEADSGGHTDSASTLVVFPVIRQMRDEFIRKFDYRTSIHIGAAGGIGTL